MAYPEGFEPPLAVLETVVLPLTLKVYKFGAGKEARTPDIFLGKEVLYQLSYTRIILEEHRGVEPLSRG